MKILPLVAPTAFLIPISLVRSETATSRMFITPMPPTTMETAAIEVSAIAIEENRSLDGLEMSLPDKIVKSSSLEWFFLTIFFACSIASFNLLGSLALKLIC